MAQQLEPSALILDSWPVLEWIKQREPSSSSFRRLLQESVTQQTSFEMTRIDYDEVIYTIRKSPDIRDRERALEVFVDLSIRVHSIDDALVDHAVNLKSQYPFSFADAFAAALAIRLQAQLVTGDTDFRSLEADGLLTLECVGA